MESQDEQLESLRRAFDACFLRMCKAATVGELEDELSNTINHLYKLRELIRKRLGKKVLFDALTSTPDLRCARAALWARTFDVHEVAVVGSTADPYSDYYTNMYGVLVWKPLISLPDQMDKDGVERHVDYQERLEGRPVLDTIRVAFDSMTRLLQSA